MFKFFKRSSNKDVLFYVFMILSIVPLFFFKYYVSLDGAQHLYNANVLTEIIKGNQAIRDYFIINPVIVGYWAGHFFLSFFKFFFSAWLAEKFFIISYIISIAFSFRYLIRSINKENDYLSILIFPFAYSMYFMMGYYSFSIAFIPVFLVFGFIIRHPKLNLKNGIILSFLFLFLFLSHAFVFAFTGLVAALYLILDFLFSKIRKEEIVLKNYLKKIGIIIMAAIPSGILWLIYIKHVMLINNTVSPVEYSTRELTYFLLRIRQLVAFNHNREAVGLILIFIVLIILFASFLMSISKLKKENRVNELFSSKNIWFVIAFFFLFLYYVMPDRISAGSLINRIGLMFFYFLIIALAMQKVPKRIAYFSVILLFISFLYLQIYRTGIHIKLNKIVADIHTAEKHIKKNSTLYTIRCSDNWFDLHFGCYVGTDKQIVNLKSPQNRGQFPIVWNYENLPTIKMGNKIIRESKPDFMPKSLNNSVVLVDYVLIYHKHKEYELSKIDQENLKQFYKLIYSSPGGYAELFEIKK